MFDSLDDQMKRDELKEVSTTQRMMRWGLGILMTVLIFGGLYLGYILLEGT